MPINKWSNEEINILKELYPKLGAHETAVILNRSDNAVTVKATRLGIKAYHHTVKTNYFDTIDTADKAYWLGFITADGYVTYNPKHRSYTLGIELNADDKFHIEKFTNAIDSDAQITTRLRHNFVDKGYNTVYKMASVRIYSKYMVESLFKYGIIPNKTYILSSIKIPDEYIWDYIRGYFDGDGTFSYTRKSCNDGEHIYARIGFVCHEENFLKNLQQIFDKHNIKSHINRDRKWWTLQIRHSESVKLFCDLIYSEANTKLDRKYEKYCKFYDIKLPA